MTPSSISYDHGNAVINFSLLICMKSSNKSQLMHSSTSIPHSCAKKRYKVQNSTEREINLANVLSVQRIDPFA